MRLKKHGTIFHQMMTIRTNRLAVKSMEEKPYLRSISETNRIDTACYVINCRSEIEVVMEDEINTCISGD